MKKIGVIIPTHNRKEHLKTVLDCVNAQNTEGLHLEIIVVVDGSTDGTLEMLEKEYGSAHVIRGDGNWWFTKSLNKGLDYISTQKVKLDYILTINDDIIIPNDYISVLLKTIKTLPANSILGSVSVSSLDENVKTFTGLKKLNRIIFKYYKYTDNDWIKSNIFQSVVLPTRGIVFPYSLIEVIGKFDISFPQYGSDYDFILRAKQAGYNAYITNATYIVEFQELTSNGNPRLNKSLKNYLKQLFFNPYSSNYFWKDLKFEWRHGYKAFIPIYFLLLLVRVFYVYFKYNKIKLKKSHIS